MIDVFAGSDMPAIVPTFRLTMASARIC